ncbi:MAG: hypothetical protein V3V08_21770 [Nannocystaceae bacterium]
MSAVVHAAPLDPRDPAQAVQDLVCAAMDVAPRRREVTLLTVEWGRRRAGCGLAPWTMPAIQRALQRRGFSHLTAAGKSGHTACDPSCATTTAMHRAMTPLRLAENVIRAQLPVGWLGTNLVLVAPLAHRKVARRWASPCASAMLALAHAMGLDGDVAIELPRLLAEVFATTTLVLDATWWTAVDTRGRPMADPRCVGHCLVTSSLTQPTTSTALDEWIDSRLAIRRAFRPTGTDLRCEGDLGIWPTARLPRARISIRGLRSLRCPAPAARHRDKLNQAFAVAWNQHDPMVGKAFESSAPHRAQSIANHRGVR